MTKEEILLKYTGRFYGIEGLRRDCVIFALEKYAQYILSRVKHKHSAYDKDFAIDRNINNYLLFKSK